MKTFLLLGSGELGKEFAISAKRMGHRVIACDSYDNAPAMQVADLKYVFNMLNSERLLDVIKKTNPDFIIPEIEAIRTEALIEVENDGKYVVPNARAVNLTMNRDHIRDRANELGLKTAKYNYATTENEIKTQIKNIGFPCILKPVMSSSGKGQAIINNFGEIRESWMYATKNMRGDRKKVIIEEFIDFEYEITLLTIKQKNRETIFCDPIGHIQVKGDYEESWQPHVLNDELKIKAQNMSRVITNDLGGVGLFGVEFFIRKNEVIFSELSPRPHDTGMVTMYTQNLNEFDLHLRAVLGLPIPNIKLFRSGYSFVIKADKDMKKSSYRLEGIQEALALEDVDIRIFGKPYAYANRSNPNTKTASRNS